MLRQLKFDYYKIKNNLVIKLMFIIAFVFQFVLAYTCFNGSGKSVFNAMFTMSAEVAFLIIPIISVLICSKDFSSQYIKNIYSETNKFCYVLSKFIYISLFSIIYAILYFISFYLCSLIFGTGVIYRATDDYELWQYIVGIVRWIVIMMSYGSIAMLIAFAVKKEHIAIIIILPYALYVSAVLYGLINNCLTEIFNRDFEVDKYSVFGVSLLAHCFENTKHTIIFFALRVVYLCCSVFGGWMLLVGRIKTSRKKLLDNLNDDCVVKIDNVHKSFNGKTVLDGVSFDVNKGEVYGLVGNNGAGKTTLLKLMCGLLKADSGNFRWAKQGIATNVGALIDGHGLYYDMSASDNLKAKAVFLGCKYNEKEIEERLRYVGLDDVGTKKVGKFSMGMKQRLGIALALVGNPKLILLDEPASSLDPQGINEIRKIILKIHSDKQSTLIISSHLLEELVKVATQFCVLHKGKIIKQIATEKLIEECGQMPLDEYYINLTSK